MLIAYTVNHLRFMIIPEGAHPTGLLLTVSTGTVLYFELDYHLNCCRREPGANSTSNLAEM